MAITEASIVDASTSTMEYDAVHGITRPHSLAHDLVLPTLLFAALGGMTWAVRGCSGFGAMMGCIFAGVTWGAAWWFIARDPTGEQSRRYASGWIILALTVGIGISGARGWMQWPSFFEGRLQTNAATGEFVPISRTYGFIWLFIAGVPWAGIGACMLAWCGSARPTRAWQWALRLACGIGGAALAVVLFREFPQYFMPLYRSIEERYQDFDANPNLRRLTNDSRSAILHLGVYLGFLLFEIGRRDWKNVVLILTVGVVNGAGWSLLQNWKWAAPLWPEANFNWWRCWESSGGISIGIAYGIAYYLVNRRMAPQENARRQRFRQSSAAAPSLDWLGTYYMLMALLIALMGGALSGWFGLRFLSLIAYFGAGAAFAIAYYVTRRGHNAAPAPPDPNLERWGVSVGLLLGLGLSIKGGLKGWANIYWGNEDYWNYFFWNITGPVLLVILAAVAARILLRPLPRDFRGDPIPHAYALIWLVLIVQNIIAQMVTGPSVWNEVAFSIYYVLLFLISAVIVYHYHVIKGVHLSADGAIERSAGGSPAIVHGKI